jgi:hypothetical protein
MGLRGTRHAAAILVLAALTKVFRLPAKNVLVDVFLCHEFGSPYKVPTQIIP